MLESPCWSADQVQAIFALQFLVHGVQAKKEPGIFVALEETCDRILASFESFHWRLKALRPKTLFFLDAQPAPDYVQSATLPRRP